MTFRPIICIDFDGVLHSYTSGWLGADVAADPPVTGAIEWLRALVEGGEVEPVVYSSRSQQEGGILCMQEWLIKHGMAAAMADSIKFPERKPAAFLTIDDRAICFEGVFPSVATMKAFKPWNKQEQPDTRCVELKQVHRVLVDAHIAFDSHVLGHAANALRRHCPEVGGEELVIPEIKVTKEPT